MVAVQPFRGLRYNQTKADALEHVLAPPYDVVSPDERERLVARSPYNIVQIELPVGGEDRYRRAADLLAGWRRDAILTQEHAPALYVLEERFVVAGGEYRRLGVLAAVTVEPWSSGAVLPHEHTLPGPKLDRLRLLQATQTNISPIFLMYDDPGGQIRAMLQAVTEQEPVASVQLDTDAIPHAARESRLWPVTDSRLLDRFLPVFAATQAYIADGHHRYETALTYREEQRRSHPEAPDGPWDAALMFLVAVDDPGLVVLPTHRVLRNIDPERLARLPAGLGRHFSLESVPAGTPLAAALQRLAEAGPGALLVAGLPQGLTLLLPRADLAAALPADRSTSWRSLDVSALHGLILEPLLGLGDAEISGEQYVQYTRDAAEALQLVEGGQAQLALLLNATRPEQVCAVARDHERMPQKSTFYYPKPLTGFVLYPQDR
ncbi:MAG TPA: DUF1015 domain-containing protein [Chloroflexota bacterium]|nr:DUF1015 domain-containing protein [Chloroflexota bacterium]